jgi:hypothetical protein
MVPKTLGFYAIGRWAVRREAFGGVDQEKLNVYFARLE